MPDLLPFFKILPILALALASPGPDFMLVSTVALSRGRMAGIQGAAGIAAGIVFYAGLSIWGLGVLFEQVAWLILAIKVIGGLYLCYLGIQLWRSTLAQPTEIAAAEIIAPEKQRNPFWLGFLTNLTNPKAVAFFASVFALALTPDTTAATRLTTTLLCTLTAFLWFAFVAVALSTPSVRRRYEQAKNAINRVAGSILMLFGLKLMWSSRS